MINPIAIIKPVISYLSLIAKYPTSIFLPISGEHVTKDELRAELERQAQRYKDVYGGEVITYAAQPDPDRKPWRKKPTVQDQAFQQEIKKIEEARNAE